MDDEARFELDQMERRVIEAIREREEDKWRANAD